TAIPEDTTLAPMRIFNQVVPSDTILAFPLAPAAHVAGTVRNAQGDPIAGAVFKFDLPAGGRQPATENATDASGFYRLSVLPGIYRVTVEPPVGSPYAAVRIPDVDVTNNLQRSFTLPTGAVVAGTVTDQSGHPVPNARWTATDTTGALVAIPNSTSG